MNWSWLMPWRRVGDTSDDTRGEAREQLERLSRQDAEITRLSRELRETQRRNNFSGMVQQAITRAAREGA